METAVHREADRSSVRQDRQTALMSREHLTRNQPGGCRSKKAAEKKSVRQSAQRKQKTGSETGEKTEETAARSRNALKMSTRERDVYAGESAGRPQETVTPSDERGTVVRRETATEDRIQQTPAPRSDRPGIVARRETDDRRPGDRMDTATVAQ